MNIIDLSHEIERRITVYLIVLSFICLKKDFLILSAIASFGDKVFFSIVLIGDFYFKTIIRSQKKCAFFQYVILFQIRLWLV